MSKSPLPLEKVYRFLEPGPVTFITTSRKGVPNVMTQSWHTMMEFEPPLVGMIVSNRDYSFEALKSTKECTISIPSALLAKKVIQVGNTSGKRLNKFERFGLTPLPAERVKSPLIAECFADFECRVVNTRLMEKYNFFVVQVVRAWTDRSIKNTKTLHHHGKGVFSVAGRTIKIPTRMPR